MEGAKSRRESWSAEPLVPRPPTLRKLRSAAAGCTACPLWKSGTQTVFGAGNDGARIILVGEQPGNEEDLTGQPFVGPAGKLLDKCLAEAGIDREAVYVTNAVKHFKWVPSGKRRLHKKPGAREIAACRPWLEAEIEVLEPELIVCLGATAAQALLGREFRVTQRRGELIAGSNGRRFMATIHPSAILRAPDREQRDEETRRFVADLRKAAAEVGAEQTGTKVGLPIVR